MFRCRDCRRYFNEPVVTSPEQDTGAYDVLCPHCGGDDLEDAEQCACGMNNIPKTHEFCEDCYEKVRLSMDRLKEDLGYSQEDFEQIISNHFGW